MDRIIVSRTDSIGDVVLTLPMLAVIKSRFPSLHLIFLGREYTRAVVEACAHVDEFCAWDSLEAQGESAQLDWFAQTGADAIVHVYPNRRIARLAKKSGIAMRIGTAHRNYHWLYCNRRPRFSRSRSDLHEAQLNLKLLAPLHCGDILELPELAGMYGLDRSRLCSTKVDAILDKDRYSLILHPKSRGSAVEWGVDNFTRLVELLPGDYYQILLTGTEPEGETIGQELRNHPNVTDLTGKLSLQELLALIAGSDGLLAASTGPLHLAAALGIDTLGLFAPRRPIHPGRWAPLGGKADFFVAAPDCPLCAKEQDCDCIRRIPPAQAAEWIAQRAESRFTV